MRHLSDHAAVDAAKFIQEYSDDPYVQEFVNNCWMRIDVTPRRDGPRKYVPGAPRSETKAELLRMATELGWQG